MRRAEGRRSRRSPPASPACCRCSTSAAASSGRRCPTRSAARPPITCFFLLGIAALRARADLRPRSASKALFVRRLLHHPVDVWRRLRDHSGLSRRHVRHAVRRRHPRPPADRLVDRRHHRPGGRELHPRVRRSPPACRRDRSTTSRCTSWPACWWSGLICQRARQAARRAMVHERRGGRRPAGASRQARERPCITARSASAGAASTPRPSLAWAVVGLPIAWGVWVTLSKTFVLFR